MERSTTLGVHFKYNTCTTHTHSTHLPSGRQGHISCLAVGLTKLPQVDAPGAAAAHKQRPVGVSRQGGGLHMTHSSSRAQ